MSDQDQNQQQSSGRSTAYTDVGKLYDNNHGALGITLVGRSVQFSVAPVFDDMIGQDPQKGKSMYDYENRSRITIPAFKIGNFIRQVRSLLEGGKVVEARYESQRDDTVEYISVFAPGVLDGVEGYSILVGSSKEGQDGVEAIYEFPQGSEVVLGIDADGNEVKSDEVTSDELEFFVGLLDALERLPYGLEIHGGRTGAKEFAGGTSGGSRNAGRTSSSASKGGFSRTRRAGAGKPQVSGDFEDDIPV